MYIETSCGMDGPIVICQEKDTGTGGGRRGSFEEQVGQTCQEGLSQKGSVACFDEVDRR